MTLSLNRFSFRFFNEKKILVNGLGSDVSDPDQSRLFWRVVSGSDRIGYLLCNLQTEEGPGSELVNGVQAVLVERHTLQKEGLE